MLIIDIPSAMYEVPGSWDGERRVKRLITVPPIHLEMEHSLLSISRWEAKWKISYFKKEKMTPEQFMDYCRCMTINRQKMPDVYKYLRHKDVDRINEYINDLMTARRLVGSSKGGPNKYQQTSEYFYAIMIQYGIPFDCEKWHFNRLLALIDCCQSMNSEDKPMSYREQQQFYSNLNAQRRKAWGTKG